MKFRDQNEQQKRENLRTVARDILARFDRDDIALATRADEARRDGFGVGGDGVRGSDVSNPTLGAAITNSTPTTAPATRALEELIQGVELLVAADRSRKRALPTTDAEPELDIDGIWCTSCLRINWHTPRALSKKWPQPNTRCDWCSGFHKTSAERPNERFDPPEWILKKRSRALMISQADVDRAIAEHRRNTKRKKRR